MPEHAATAWLLLAVAAFLVGVAKTSIGGLALVAVAIYATVLPTRESTAALLLVLLTGDLVAVVRMGRHADWQLLRAILPGPVPGLVLGTAALTVLDDGSLRTCIGVVLLMLVGFSVAGRRSTDAPRSAWSLPARMAAGTAAGATTMAANAGGPVMTLFLVSEGVDKYRFIGTSAWFFLGVNLLKLPFSAGIGLLAPEMVIEALLLAPAVLLGASAGGRLLGVLDQRLFETVVLAAAAASAVPLLLA